jgi:hypothetical protein
MHGPVLAMGIFQDQTLDEVAAAVRHFFAQRGQISPGARIKICLAGQCLDGRKRIFETGVQKNSELFVMFEAGSAVKVEQ